MAQSFNPENSVRFELGAGRVSLGGADDRVLVPAEALGRLCSSAGESATRDFGHRLGTQIGRRIADRVSADTRVAEMVEHLGGEVALAGLGSLSLELWGHALVLKIEGSPVGPEGDALAAAVLEGALDRSLARQTSVVLIARTDATARYLVGSPRAATQVKGWLGSGVSWGEALTRLNEAGSG